MMKTNKGFLITLITIIGIFALGFTVLLIVSIKKDLNINNVFSFKNNNEVIVDTTYDTIFNKVNINTEYGNIYIHESTDDLVHLYVYGIKDKSEIKTTDELSIKVGSEDCHFLCFNKKKSKIDLYLPNNYSSDIKIVTNYGDISFGSFENANLDISSDYGDIDIDKVFNLKVECDYGDIKINKLLNRINIASDYGDIDIEDLNINEDSKIYTDYGDIEIKKTNDIYIEAHTDLGKVKNNESNRRAEHVLVVETDYGDILVNEKE